MLKANKILEEAGYTNTKIDEVKLSKDELLLMADEMASVVDSVYTKYAKSRLTTDMKKSIGDDSFDSPEAAKALVSMITNMRTHIKNFKG